MRKEDVGYEGIDLTIQSITDETVGQELETKPVMAFREHGSKPLVMNKTVIGTLMTMFGSDDSDHWIGRRINVFNDPSVMFNGNRGGLRVRGCANIPTNGLAGRYATAAMADAKTQRQQPEFDDAADLPF